MSLFGDLSSGGIRMPDAVFDQSSMLPPLNTAGYGAGYDGTPDARINKGSSLFSDMEPYAYGKGDRLSTQAAYLANPHNIQKIVPQLRLPDSIFSQDHANFILPHSVTDGDVAFSIRFSAGEVRTEMMNNTSQFFKQGAGKAVDYICNISTINYIMRGLFTESKFVNPAWMHFATAIGFENEYNKIQDAFAILRFLKAEGADQAVLKKTLEEVMDSFRVRAELLVRDHFRPIGVVIGSEKQGGQHQVSQKTVSWPAAYIVTISIDGRNENLCNYWRHLDVSSGSELGFFVKLMQKHTYTLNYTKQITSRQFTNCNKGGEEDGALSPLYPQLCPGMNEDRCMENEVTGHWHFCMSQAMHHQTTTNETFNDITTMHVGALMLSTISVVWMRTRMDQSKQIRHGVLMDESETIFKNKNHGELKHHMDEWDKKKSKVNHHGMFSSTKPINAAHYMMAHMQPPNSRVADGKIAITLSTTPTVPVRAPVHPRMLSDEELRDLGQPPRTKARTSTTGQVFPNSPSRGPGFSGNSGISLSGEISSTADAKNNSRPPIRGSNASATARFSGSSNPPACEATPFTKPPVTDPTTTSSNRSKSSKKGAKTTEGHSV